jgi:hypothetical protein
VLTLLALSAKDIAAAVVLGVLLTVGAVVQGFVLVRATRPATTPPGVGRTKSVPGDDRAN